MRGAARSVGGGLIAIGLVVLGILLLQQLVPAPADSPAVVRPPGPGLPATRPAGPSASASVPVSPSASSSPSPVVTPAVAPKLALTVLNNSSRTGLARRAAAGFAARGWPVAGTGNLRGRFAETTVYYEPGQEASAALLRREFPGITRATPRFAGLPGRGLTVVLTRDYPA